MALLWERASNFLSHSELKHVYCMHTRMFYNIICCHQVSAIHHELPRCVCACCRIKAVVATQWLVELTTRSYDLMDDSHWEQEYCAKEDKCAPSHFLHALLPATLSRRSPCLRAP